MELTKWTPRTRDLGHGLFDRFFEDFFAPNLRTQEWLEESTWNPAVDIYDEGDLTIIKAVMPGVDKKNIDVKVEGRTLTLKGTRNVDKEVKEGNYYRKEISTGSYQRSFTLTDALDPGKIKAEYKDGILRVEIPKQEASKPKKIEIH